MRTRISTMATGLLLGLAMGGCAGSGSERGGAAVAGGSQAELVVTNQNWQDVVVYAMSAGTRWRLGNVNSMGTERFRIPHAVMGGGGAVQLVADPIGSRQAFTTDRIVINPGDRVRWTIENALPLSSYSVMRRR